MECRTAFPLNLLRSAGRQELFWHQGRERAGPSWRQRIPVQLCEEDSRGLPALILGLAFRILLICTHEGLRRKGRSRPVFIEGVLPCATRWWRMPGHDLLGALDHRNIRTHLWLRVIRAAGPTPRALSSFRAKIC